MLSLVQFNLFVNVKRKKNPHQKRVYMEITVCPI